MAHVPPPPPPQPSSGIPRTMISQSDFINPKGADATPKNLEKKHAFVYSNLVGPPFYVDEAALGPL